VKRNMYKLPPRTRATAETPARVAERIRAREAVEIMAREVDEKFGQITPENAGAVLAYQDKRLRELGVRA